eukprot:TRINITY_DN12312_c0_g1_i6.p2 TRINITY_DN12312_c0_g1~~TRINITY_DN12312_c0_g1_i6.p2  ORF type:complete len:328 (+),score=59.23 TRINITY_DN12312_c0_g1_i6:2846-3829(+)
MDCEETMIANAENIKRANPKGVTWVYCNSVEALPWLTHVREKLEDPQYSGFFMAKAGCVPRSGHYICGPNATDNLYHDFEQTPQGACGVGVECGEYVFDHRNSSLQAWLLNDYFMDAKTGGNNPNVDGFYVDDSWSTAGPSEMDSDAVQKMGMSTQDVQDMIAAWTANQNAWRETVLDNGLFEWFLFYGTQQNAPGWDQTKPWDTCASYMRANCGPNTPPQNGTLFFGFSRIEHHEQWPLPHPTEDIAAFLLTRGPYAYIGYGWVGCADSSGSMPFTKPPELMQEYGMPLGDCTETNPGVFQREYSRASVTLDCNQFKGHIDMKDEV